MNVTNTSSTARDIVITLASDSRKELYLPIYILTGVFGAIFILGPLFFRKNPNKEIIRWAIMLSAICMWAFWVTVYISQMNPLLGPRVQNTTLAWVVNKRKPLTSSGNEKQDDVVGDDGDDTYIRRMAKEVAFVSKVDHRDRRARAPKPVSVSKSGVGNKITTATTKAASKFKKV